MSEEEKKECPICAQPFTGAVRKPCRCPYCNESACKPCYQTYLVDVVSPMCMFCKKMWNFNLIGQYFSVSWINKELKETMKRNLTQVEKAKLPLTSDYITRMNDMKKRLEEAEVEYENARIKRQRLYNEVDLLKKFTDMKLTEFDKEYEERFIKSGDEPIPQVSKQTEERNKFTMPCTKTGCLGFMSSSYKCPVCSTKVCKDCHVELIEVERVNENNEKITEYKGLNNVDHVCDPGTVETLQQIRKESKFCPKCHVPIFKIHGCDQMFCTNCNTPFNWRTGKISTGHIHNPHYFDYLNSRNDGRNATNQIIEPTCVDGLTFEYMNSLMRAVWSTYSFKTPLTLRLYYSEKANDYKFWNENPEGSKYRDAEKQCCTFQPENLREMEQLLLSLTTIYLECNDEYAYRRNPRNDLLDQDGIDKAYFQLRLKLVEKTINEKTFSEQVMKINKQQRYNQELHQLRQALAVMINTSVMTVMQHFVELGNKCSYSGIYIQASQKHGLYAFNESFIEKVQPVLQEALNFIQYYNKQIENLNHVYQYSAGNSFLRLGLTGVNRHQYRSGRDSVVPKIDFRYRWNYF
jgi:hypothetical protein